jgi:L-fuconolactonase
MQLDRFDWLAQRVESAIDPDRVIVDPHHHLWKRGGSTYLAPELLADLTVSHNVIKTVFVDCLANYDRDLPKHMAPVGETRLVAGEADATDAAGGPTIAGIVSHADMMLGNAVEEVLAAHDAAGGGRFRGIRHATSWDASDEIGPGHSKPFESMMITDDFRTGVRKLAAMGFSFDAWIFHPQLGELADLAANASEVTIILNHLGGPMGVGPYAGRHDEIRVQWRNDMSVVAANPNVMLKVGGIGMSHFYGMDWNTYAMPPGSEEVAAFWADDVHFCIDLFGPDRCMFESNFPVDRQTLTYSVLWNSLQILATRYSDAEQGQLFAGTAERVYRLP